MSLNPKKRIIFLYTLRFQDLELFEFHGKFEDIPLN